MYLPAQFDYDQRTRTVVVEYCDGSKIRYYEVPPESIFLVRSNERRNRDWFLFLALHPSIKKETIQAATKTPGRPLTPSGKATI